jgi:outer membrane lipoprotein-sorting protein
LFQPAETRVKQEKEFMHSRKPIFAASIVLALLAVRGAFAADNLESVLHRLDASAASFHTTSAEFEFDTVTTVPIYDKDVQKGTAYYKREGHSFQMAAHITEVNGKLVPKDLAYSDGKVVLFEPLQNQARVMDAAKYESYLLLGFGASGKELADRWQIKYDGEEVVDGMKTDKLELVAKDPNVLKLFPKITVWLDTDRAVSLKQLFDEGQGVTRTCTYSHFKTNQGLPKDAFVLKTNKQTHFIK